MDAVFEVRWFFFSIEALVKKRMKANYRKKRLPKWWLWKYIRACDTNQTLFFSVDVVRTIAIHQPQRVHMLGSFVPQSIHISFTLTNAYHICMKINPLTDTFIFLTQIANFYLHQKMKKTLFSGCLSHNISLYFIKHYSYFPSFWILPIAYASSRHMRGVILAKVDFYTR